MFEFIWSLPKRMKEIDLIDTSEYDYPQGAVRIDEEAPEEIKRILSLYCDLNQRIEFLSEALETSCMDSERQALTIALEKAKAQCTILHGMLDLALVEAYPDAYLGGKHVAYIGANWEIFRTSKESLGMMDQSDVGSDAGEASATTFQ